MSTVCVVSGESETEETADALRMQGHEVLRGQEVDEEAGNVLSAGRFLVVAHGDENGTVFLCRDVGVKGRWLWVGMPDPPTGVRLYVYACHAGRMLVPALNSCESFGHVDRVPAVGAAGQDCVSRFLAHALSLLGEKQYDRVAWQRSLCEFLDEELKVAYGEGSVEEVWATTLLRRSLNFGREMWT